MLTTSVLLGNGGNESGSEPGPLVLDGTNERDNGTEGKLMCAVVCKRNKGGGGFTRSSKG